MRREFDSLVKNNTFEWLKVSKNKNIIGSRWFFTKKVKATEVMSMKLVSLPKATHKYMVRIIEKPLL